MAEINYNKFGEEVERISQEISEKKNSPEHAHMSEKEILKHVVRPMVKITTNLSPLMPSTSGITDDDGVLPNYLKDSPAEIKAKVEDLVSVAFKEGIEKTAIKAQIYGPFVLDAFHDALTDKLYDELRGKGII